VVTGIIIVAVTTCIELVTGMRNITVIMAAMITEMTTGTVVIEAVVAAAAVE
jgi:hypothetical protein